MLASFILLLAAFAFAAELEITTTHEVFCTRKTVVGDTISVHYRGTLPAIPDHETEVFDSSYDRKPSKPFMFTLGKGQVIAGYVCSIFFFPLALL
jgi:FK506-binding protein 2